MFSLKQAMNVVPYTKCAILKAIIALFVLFPVLALAQDIDPTAPFGQHGRSLALEQLNGRLLLETIVHGDKIHTAVINGKVLKVGEYLGEYQLVAVNDRSVVLRSGQESLKLSLFSDVIVKK